MITAIWFDDMITIPDGAPSGPSSRMVLVDQSFRRADGWDIRETLPGVFSLHIEGMSAPVTIGGYGYSYTSEPEAEPDDGTPKRRGKR